MANHTHAPSATEISTATRKTAIIIGSGVGGLSLGIRLQSLGFNTTIVEKLDAPGGRAYVRRAEGFTFDMGPTVLTVPHFIEELFSLERDQNNLAVPDFPPEILGEEKRIKSGISGGPNTSRYIKIIPILPFYRIYFDDGTFFDYDGDPEHTIAQIKTLAPEDVEGYERFYKDAKAIFERGFLELGYTHFGDLPTMLKVVPDLLKLDAVRPLFDFVKKYFKSDKLRQVFSFESLLVGGNPLAVPAIYAMIHFVERTWGIHFPMGGTGALMQAFVRKFEELGGAIRYNSEVTQILVGGPHGAVPERNGKKIVRGVQLADGTELFADLVVSNGDYANTYMKLIDKEYRTFNTDIRVKLAKQGMSIVVIYFGFRDDEKPLDLRHHNIILGPRYEALLREIFGKKIIGKDFSQYLHIPTLTDPTLAPPGHHAAYTLIPVPHTGSGIDWETAGPQLVDRVLTFLDERGYIPNLCNRLVYKSFVTPRYFEQTLNSYMGNGFGVEPVLWQTAFFRPHNRSMDIEKLYLVGANVQPGGGTPSVMMSAKMTARLIAEDFAIAPNGVAAPKSTVSKR
jgi:phytoene desaturase